MVRGWRLFALLVGLACWLSSDCPARSIDPNSVLDAITWMDHQAGLVESARGDFTVTYLPTSPEEMERLAALCLERGYEHRASGYHLSARRAGRRSYHAVWWRRGIKEREERTHPHRPAIVETTVFDGTVVKTLDGTPGRTRLYLASPATNWTHKSRIQPFTFAFEYQSLPHVEILRGSPQRRVVRRRAADEGRWEVIAQHPTDERLVLRMIYDDQRRLVQRDAILTSSSSFMDLDGEQPAVYSRWEFSQFRAYDDGRGNRLWFPSHAMLRFYLGNLPDGSPVQTMAIQVDVGDIQFNVDVPDATFVLDAPEGVPIYDQRDSGYSMISVSY